MSKKKLGIDLYQSIMQKNKPEKNASIKPLPSTKVSSDKAANLEFLKNIEKKSGILKVTAEKDGYKKTAKFLLLLGRDEASKVIKHLPQNEVEKICREIALIERVDRVEAEAILSEFGFLKQTEPDRKQGGIAAAKEILAKTFGNERADEILNSAIPEAKSKPFSFLDDIELPQLLLLIKNESNMVISVMLSYIAPQKAAEILKTFDSENQKELVIRMSRMDKIDSIVIESMETQLKEKLKNQDNVESEEVDGTSALANILKYMDLSDEKRILNTLEEEDPDLSYEVKEQIFTEDTIIHLLDSDMQEALRNFNEPQIAMILKGKDKEFSDKILNNLSARRRGFVEEELDLLGLVRKSEVEKATKEFLQFLREKEEKGEYRIIREEEDLI